MQDYISFAEKNGVKLESNGVCQFCGANTVRGIHECLEIFNLGFEGVDFSLPENHRFKFFVVDAHTLQHPEIHGRWNNHFHLSRLHLIFQHNISWTYQLSPKLSTVLNEYKVNHLDEYLTPPSVLNRGTITSITIQKQSTEVEKCKSLIQGWAKEVYDAWKIHHKTVDVVAQIFLKTQNRY